MLRKVGVEEDGRTAGVPVPCRLPFPEHPGADTPMATSLLVLLDDIASVLDDVGAMTKAATAKTAGVIGDDLALNAHQLSGVDPARELAVVWRVALGSLRNKAILVPAALALSWLAPWAVAPLLVLGGAYLCYEGAEKVFHPHASADAVPRPTAEGDKIAGAIRTDFILSAEIIVITLGVVAGQPLGIRVAVLAVAALAMTVGVYGFVAAIVRLDDLGLAWAGGSSPALRLLGRGILAAAPWMLRGLSVAGTAAMFVVGGGILVHSLPWLHGVADAFGGHAGGGSGEWLCGIGRFATEATLGMAAGLAVLLARSAVDGVRGARTA